MGAAPADGSSRSSNAAENPAENIAENIAENTAERITTRSDCPFCRAVDGLAPAHIVASDDDTVTLLTNAPASAGHLLVLPRRHVTELWSASSDEAAALGRATAQMARLLRDRLAPDGVTVRQNNGAASGQRVAHLHVHLVPRWHGDGSIGWPIPPAEPPDPDEVLARLTAG